MASHDLNCLVGYVGIPLQGADAMPFIEGGQTPPGADKEKPQEPDLSEPGFLARKLGEAVPDDRSERIPSRMVEDRGDDEASLLVKRSPILCERSPFEEDVGDKPRFPLSASRLAPELSLDPTILRIINSDAALDEGYMVSELLKKGRLKNCTYTEKDLVLEGGEALSTDRQDQRQVSVLLQATQNITLRYQVIGTVGHMEEKESVAENHGAEGGTQASGPEAVSRSPRALSSSDEMLYFKEKVRSAPGSLLDRKGTSCSTLYIPKAKVPAKLSLLDKLPVQKKTSNPTFPPAYSPSQLNINRIKSQIAELTLKTSSGLSQAQLCTKPTEPVESGRTESPCQKLSKITQIVVRNSRQPIQTDSAGTQKIIKQTLCVTTDAESSTKSHPENCSMEEVELLRRATSSNAGMLGTSAYDKCRTSFSPCELLDKCIKDMPLLDVLETSEFPVSPAEKVKRRVKRYYGREEDFIAAHSVRSSSNESLVQLDFSTMPTETSETAADRCHLAEPSESKGTDQLYNSSTSWYSFDSEPRGSQLSQSTFCDAKLYENSWHSYKNDCLVSKVEMTTRNAGTLGIDNLSEEARMRTASIMSSCSSSAIVTPSTSSSSTSSACPHEDGKGDSRTTSRAETVIERKKISQEEEVELFKASNLIRYFESIH